MIRPAHILPLTVILILVMLSCSRIPDADFYEGEGIISVSAPSLLTDDGGWHLQQTLTSDAVVSVSHSDDRAGTLDLNVYVRRAGSYTLWLLGRSNENQYPTLRLFDEESFLLDSYRPRLSEREIPVWISRDADGGSEMVFDLPRQGHYRLVIESGGVEGIELHRIHLALQNREKPWGMGYPETRSVTLDPRLMKREHTVYIPPKWTFGLIASSADPISDFTDRTGLNPDAWWRNDPDSDLIEGYSPGFDEERGGRFQVLRNADSVDDLRDAWMESAGEDQLRRGFLLAPFNRLDDPEFKKYPALSRLSDDRDDGFAELRRQVVRAGNPRKASYEIPFSFFMPPWMAEDSQVVPDDELFLRWAQAAALNTHFVLPFPDEADYSPSDEVLDQIRHLAEFRNSLFPYIYSYTLRARTTRIKPVIGREDSPDQYMLGEHILVAPILERDRSSRTVYFPEGGWIDIESGERFEGGQSWVVEESGRLPLIFAKKGAIIPSRTGGERVTDGSNEELTVDVFAGESGTFRFYEDDGWSTAYRTGDFTTIAYRYFEHTDYATFNIGAIVRDFEGQREETSYTLRFRNMREPVSVDVNETELEQGTGSQNWNYHEPTRTLHIYWDQPNNRRSEFMIRF